MPTDTRRLTIRVRDFLDRDVEDLPVTCSLSAGDRAVADQDGTPPERLVVDTEVTTWTDSDGIAVFDLIPTENLVARNTYEITFAGFPRVVFTMPDADSDLYDLIAQNTPVRNQQLPPANGLSDGTYPVADNDRWTTGYPIYRQPTAPTGVVGTALWVDTSTSGRPVLKVWNGTAWEDADNTEANEVDTAHLADGSVTHPKLAQNAVEADNIAADEIGGRELAPSGIDNENLFGDRVVTTRVLADQAVTTEKLTPGSVLAGFLGSEAVGTANIQNAAVTAPKIAAGVIGGDSGDGHIAAGSVDTDDLADDAVTAPKLAADAVVMMNIADDAVGSDQLAANSVNSQAIASNAVGSGEIAAGAVDTSELADGAVTRPKIADAAVGELQIAEDGVTTSRIEDGAVTQAKLAAGIILPPGSGAVDTAHLADDSVTPAKLDADTDAQKAAFRGRLGIADDNGYLLYSGRLTAGQTGSGPQDDVGYFNTNPAIGSLPGARTFTLDQEYTIRQISNERDPANRSLDLVVTPEVTAGERDNLILVIGGQAFASADRDGYSQAAGYGGTGSQFEWNNAGIVLENGQSYDIQVGGPLEIEITRRLAALQIATGQITDGAVTAPKLAADAVTTAKIADRAVTPTKLGIATVNDVRALLNALGWNTIDQNTTNQVLGILAGEPELFPYITPNDSVVQAYQPYADAPTGTANASATVGVETDDLADYRYLHLTAQGASGDPASVWLETSAMPTTGNNQDVGDITINTADGDIFYNPALETLYVQATGETPRILLVTFTNYPPTGGAQGGAATGQSSPAAQPAQYVSLWKRATTMPALSELAQGQADSPVWNGLNGWSTRPVGWHELPSGVPGGSGSLYQARTLAVWNPVTDAFDLRTWTIAIADGFNVQYTAFVGDPNRATSGVTTTATPSASSRWYRRRNPTTGAWSGWVSLYSRPGAALIAQFSGRVTSQTQAVITNVTPALDLDDFTKLWVVVDVRNSFGQLQYRRNMPILAAAVNVTAANLTPQSGVIDREANILVRTSESQDSAGPSASSPPNVGAGSTAGFNVKFFLRGDPATRTLQSIYAYQWGAVNQFATVRVYAE